MLSEKNRRIIIHTGTWFIILIFPLLSSFMLRSKMDIANMAVHITDIVSKIFIFYVNRLYFVTYLIDKKHIKYFSISTLFVVILTLFVHIFVRIFGDYESTIIYGNSLSSSESYRIFVSLFSNFLVLGVSSAICFKDKMDVDQKRIQQVEQLQVATELNLLKNQIHPHFFFNTLNNIHYLVETDTRKAQDSIVELSRLMRYLLYESSDYFVELKKEIIFTNHFLSLMKMRIPDTMKLSFRFPKNPEQFIIPPLLLITLIENAFKHCNPNISNAFINCSLSTDDNILIFMIENTKNQPIVKDSSNSLGLNNLRQRLILLYPDNHKLRINENKHVFQVKLFMNFQNKKNNEITMHNT